MLLLTDCGGGFDFRKRELNQARFYGDIANESLLAVLRRIEGRGAIDTAYVSALRGHVY